MQGWFEKFRSQDFNFEDALRSGRPTDIEDDGLKAFVEANPSQAVREIAEGLGVSETADTDGLKHL